MYVVKNIKAHLCFLTGRKSAELQQSHHSLPIPAHFHHGNHHAVLPHERVFQQGELGGSLQWNHLLHSLSASYSLLRLAGPHYQGYENHGGMLHDKTTERNKFRTEKQLKCDVLILRLLYCVSESDVPGGVRLWDGVPVPLRGAGSRASVG